MSIISPVATDASGNVRETGSLQTLGKDDFLQLLVTKLQHQDPLNPVEDEDFVAQLAQFSTLEQMNNISEGIASSNQWDFLQMQSLNNMMASGLIGQEVTADFSGVYYDGSAEPQITYSMDKPATEVTFLIRDEQGSVVATLTEKDVLPGTGSIKWDGKDDRGNQASEGYYTVEAIASTASGGTFDPDLEIVGRVTTISYRDGAAYVMINGTEVSLGDIRSVGEPEEE